LRGLFIHSDPGTIEKDTAAVPPRFGLVDASPGRWAALDRHIDSLEREAKETGSGVKYKVVFAGRHGEVRALVVSL
jgi:hypothetical protein